MAESPVQPTQPAIAVVGVSALFPGSTDAGGFWRDILAGTDLITEVPETHWLVDDYYDADPRAVDKTYCKRGAFLKPIAFDPVEHGIPPSIMPATDTSQLLALMVAKQVLDDATQGQFANMNKDRVSVILGVTSGQELFVEMGARLQRPQWLMGLRESGVPEDEAQRICDRIASQYVPWQESSFPGLLGNVVAGRIANRFDLGGTNCVTDAACASSLSALSMALNELSLGQSDMVIAGGVDTFNDISMFMCFSKTPALSPSGDCRPFSDQADGTIIGEGLTMLALKRLSDAERDGDRVYAVIKGLGASSDGRAMSVYAPLSAGQAKALRRAYEQAGYGPETVELVEAHGTGTKAGDAAEFGGLKMVFGDESARSDKQWCALGSVKSQIGHTKSTAGAAGLFKAVMALHHKVLPPTIKVDKPNGKMEIDQSPFYLNTVARPWVRSEEHPRRASVSAFGFGGSNFHVALEEYTGPAPKAWRARTFPTELVVLTAAEPDALAAEARAIAADTLPAGTLAYLARTTQEGFDVDRPARLAIVATDEADLARKLMAAAEAIDRSPRTAFSLPTGVTYAFGQSPGQVAFLFPGQGSQYVNMGADLAMAFDEAREVWDRASAVRLGDGTRRLDQVVFPIPVFDDEAREAQHAVLTTTQWAQPAIGVTSLAHQAVLKLIGLTPDQAAGHSFGELTALAAAGVLDEEDLVTVGRRRGELMATAGGSAAGSMAAVGLSAAALEEHLAGWNLDVVIANDNSPKQVVISGSTEAVTEAERRLGELGVTVRRLPVAAAFHSPLVVSARAPFEAFLGSVDFGPAEIPVYSNAEAAPYPADGIAARTLLASQLARPVRFVEQIRAMYDAGARTFVEVGPSTVLTGLVGDVLGDADHRAIALDRKGQHGVTALWQALGQLAVGGVPLDFSPLWQAYAPAVDPRSVKKPKFSLPISGTNYGKLYPPPGGAAALPAPNPARPAVAAPPAEVRVAAAVAQAVPASNGLASAAKPAPAATPTPVARRSPHGEHMPYRNGTSGSPDPAAPGAVSPSGPVAPVPQQPVVVPQPPAPQPVVAQAGPPAGANPAAAQAYALYQQALAESHMAYLKAMETSLAQTQMAFMRSMEATFLGYCGVAPAAGAPFAPPMVPPLPAMPTMPPVHAAPVPAPLAEPPMPAPVASVAAAPAFVPPPAPVAAAVAPIVPVGPPPAVTPPDAVAPPAAVLPPAAMAPPVPVASAPAAAAPVASPLAGIDMNAVMLEVVAEKTGYPVEMLTMEMALEADLGVDSIKRVEILSAVQDRVPGLPDIDPSGMASLRTLGEIADYLKPGLAAATAPHGVATASVAAPPAPVAAAPQAPAVPAAVPPAPAVTHAAAAASAPAASGLDFAALEQLMLAVVAEKTGYPVEMLTMEMALEADLGVDSIKRVEILSAVQERAPGLPEVDASAMASLRTLGQIVEFMGQGLGAASAVAPAAPAAVQAPHVVVAQAPAVSTPAPGAIAKPAAAPAPAAASAPGTPSLAELTELMLSVVAEKTGYPVEMLSLEMALEADLGVDSIKRVEILSAVQERAPGLPEVDASAMASLRTLGQIVEFMSAGVAPASAPRPTEAAIGPRPNLTVVEASTTVAALTAPEPIQELPVSHIEAAVAEAASPAPEAEAINTAVAEPAPAEAAELPAAEAPTVPAPQRLVPVASEGHSFAQAAAPRQELRQVEAPATGFSLLDRTQSGPVLVASDGRGVAEALVAMLAGRGFDARLASDLAGEPAALIDLGGLADIASPEAGFAINRDAFDRARLVAAHFSKVGGTYVTVQDTGGDFGLTGRAGMRAWGAGVAGLAKSAAQEWPAARVRAIDLECTDRTPAQLAEVLVAELLFGGVEREVGLLQDGRRVSLALATATAPQGTPILGSNDVVLAAGGARGVTAATLIALAKVSQPRVVLLGRTPLEDEPAACKGLTDGPALKRALLEAAKAEGRSLTPAELGRKVNNLTACREVRDTLKQLRKAGSEALYLEADVRDAKSLEAALSPIREAWGPVTALVHGAGVLADKRLQDKTLEQFDLVFDTKVRGLQALLAATTGDPLKAIVLFSSVAGRHGNAGQADYAMANEVLNKVAQTEAGWRGDDCVVKSLNWGPWAGGMVTPELAAHFEKQGVPLLPVETGAAMLVAELRDAPQGAVEVQLTGVDAPSGAPAPTPAQVASSTPAAPAQTPPAGAVALEVAVAAATHAYLNGHRIQETPVVPAVMVLEWFLAAAREARPDLAVQAVKDLRVLKGIQLEHFADAGDHFTVRTLEGAEGPLTVLSVELRAQDGTLHYAAAIELAPQDLPPIVPPPPPVMGLEPCPWDVTDLYGDLLFHGPAFQVIRTLEGVSREGMVGELAGVNEMGWGQGPWHADVAMLDGGLQLARLWGIHMLGRPSLPTALGEFRSYRAGQAPGPVRCEVRARVAAKHRTVTDIRFIDEAGALLAELRGVEMHLLPEKRPSEMVELG